DGKAVHREIASDGEYCACGRPALRCSALDPGEVMLDHRRVEIAHAGNHPEHPRKRQNHAADGHGVDEALREPAPENAVDQKAGQRKYGYEPELHDVAWRRQFFMEFTSSIFKVDRFRNTVRIIASPTAASAAATTITKNVNRWPLTSLL